MLAIAYVINFLGMILLPIMAWIYFSKKFKLSWKLILTGGLTFIASQIYRSVDLSSVAGIPADQLELAKQQVAAYVDGLAVYIGGQVGILVVEGVVAALALVSLWIIIKIRPRFPQQTVDSSAQGAATA